MRRLNADWFGLLLWAVCPLLGIHSAVQAQSPGQYFDPTRSGHGFDLQRVGERWVLIFYTYTDEGAPLWYFATAEQSESGVIAGALELFRYRADLSPPQRAEEPVGQFSLEFATACAGDTPAAAFSWTIDGESGQWCVQSLLAPGGPENADLTGQWFAGAADQGWGLSVDFSGPAQPNVEAQILYYYDSNGFPRWAFGVADTAGASSTTSLYNYRGYCRSCEPVTLQGALAGTVGHDIEIVQGVARGRVNVDVIYAFDPGGLWLRTNSPLLLLSDPEPGLSPLPDRINPDTALVIWDVNLIPLIGPTGVIERQTVVVENGLISAIGDRASLALPVDSWHIDGRGLYLGPGLADMHTHLTASGNPAMSQSGILFIANGVTTVLNMGDGGTLNLPGIDDRFGSGLLVGPKVYGAKDAYGVSDGRSARKTVSNRASATVYAEAAVREGYDFLKLYNGLTPDVVDQFRIDGARLGLPVIGHVPKSMSMPAALDTGIQMLAHTAEVYFTFLRNQQNASLIPAAAQELISRNVYLTDTLTASDSFAAMFGGNTANFDTYLQREGTQYIPQSMINGWAGFFNSSTLQPAGSRPGQLDARLAFFKRMNREFVDAGVKMIMGSDSPGGHAGLVAGFAVHEDLRLLSEIGLSPTQIYTIASRNPGEFIDDSLGPDDSFGTLEVGKRADLLLLERNPLLDITHLKRPKAVITRGRLWSKTYLDGRLEQLQAQHHPVGSAPKLIIPSVEHAHHTHDH